ncbi:hypothetical protein CTAYLR_003138 [Chrysophaeum taylorii]|uniref:Cyclic nucleotide-binding domain-containing protein n=1 Tax=Chrysophaeum taylorii TaxID=2483200 RepID=A0AAD7UPC0_9STRA|nr:hypothetical protein CTAYLR_003138 [Chrysophaeum taylorii]
MVPVRIAFDFPAMGIMLWLEFMIDIHFILDVGLNFFTTIHKRIGFEVKVVTNRRQIALHYVKTWFCIDLVACLPLGYVAMFLAKKPWKAIACAFAPPSGCGRPVEPHRGIQSGYVVRLVKLVRIFRLLKLMRLARLSRLVDKYQDELIYVMGFISGSKLIFTLIYASHWMGCAYALVFKFDDEKTVSERYVASIYYSMQTITTVGYGDMVSDERGGSTIKARLFAIVCMGIGGLMFGWLITNVLNALSPESHERKHKELLHGIMGYLRVNRVPLSTSRRVLTHVRKQNSRQNADREMLSHLPHQLRVEIFDFLYRQNLVSVPLFHGATTKFINHICVRVMPITFLAGGHIYSRGDVAEDGLYILSAGDVVLRYSQNARPRLPPPPPPPQITTPSPANSTISDAAPLNSKHFTKKAPLTPGQTLRRRRRESVTITTATLTAGDVLGEAVVFGHARRTEDAIARTTASLMMIPTTSVQAALELDPNVARRLFKLFIDRLSNDPRTFAEVQAAIDVDAIAHALDSDNPQHLADVVVAYRRPSVSRDDQQQQPPPPPPQTRFFANATTTPVTAKSVLHTVHAQHAELINLIAKLGADIADLKARSRRPVSSSSTSSEDPPFQTPATPNHNTPRAATYLTVGR